MPTYKNFDSWQKSLTKRLEKTVKDSITELGTRVIQDTPVLTSALASNWNSSTNVPDFNFSASKTDFSSYNELEDTITRWDISDDFYFVNGADYAYSIEYEGSSPRKAPMGMLEINTSVFQNIFNTHFNNNFK